MAVRKANVTDLARYPFYPIRYLMVFENGETENTSVSKTHRAAMSACKSGRFTGMTMVDLYRRDVSTMMSMEDAEMILDLWGKNYFDRNFEFEEVVKTDEE